MVVLPTHVAIIMDGNGRWATKHGEHRLAGHAAGADKVEEVIRYLSRQGVSYITLFAFATANHSRDEEEVQGLDNLCQSFISDKGDSLHQLNAKVRFVGNRIDGKTSDELLSAMVNLEGRTADNLGINVIVAWNYSGEDELRRARASRVEAAALYHRMLDAPDVPAMDLVIRTGCDNPISLNWRDSDFFPLLSAAAVKVPLVVGWPDFKPAEDLSKAFAVWCKEKKLNGGQRKIDVVAAE